ncbi:MAG: HlyC/CorC family transporter, partial [Lachnospiraceae bacterium]|nr:HlyC/CorC family transporter [Lachnospiraceae bacterium]
MSSGPGGFMKLFSKKVNEEKVEEDILSMLEEGHEQGVIEENEAEMISNIFEFSDKYARDIMTSRQKI